MANTTETFLHKLRRWFSRSEWLIRLLRLTRVQGAGSEPGLVLIQIDGLSRKQLERAMAQGNLPFLKRLLRQQHYALHSLYSGLPSSTPAMTAELLYGVKCAVPSFSFYSRPTGTIVRMFDPRSARQIDQRLLAQGPPLLAGGSAYACIYTGGAAEPHFCAATMALDDFFRRRYPLRLFIILLLSVYSVLRVSVLMVIEFFLALFDCARGLIAGQDLAKELKSISSRVGVSILMRELATIGAKIDVTRGLPVVYLDFVGYDEQAHRRGPGSRFAHWSLKGIDQAIARIWSTARRSSLRHYEVWVFSDHGSEEMVSYLARTGRTLQDAITEVFGGGIRTFVGEHDGTAIQSGRIVSSLIARRPRGKRRRPRDGRRLAGRSGMRPRVRSSVAATARLHIWAAEPVVAAMGPIGHVYIERTLDIEERDHLAQVLVERAQIPLVAVVEDQGHVHVWTPEGRFMLPEDAALLFAPDHPFFDEIARDFMALCRHPDAGDFVLGGWSRTGRSWVFSIENGSHAGPGLEETHAFALLPRNAPIRTDGKNYLRPLDLRQAALRHLGRLPQEDSSLVARPSSLTRNGRRDLMTAAARSTGPSD